MKHSISLLPFLGVLLLISCQPSSRPTFHDRLGEMEGLKGSENYLNSPFVAAGNRVYIVGHQDATFPDLGWHVTGEMGGVWDHPIKLMDGYRLSLDVGDGMQCLGKASTFTNYPFANRHTFPQQGPLKVSRVQFVPDDVEGAVVEYQVENTGTEEMEVTLQFEAFIDLRPMWLAERQDIMDGPDSVYYEEEEQLLMARDKTNDWFVAVGSDVPVEAMSKTATCTYERRGKGVTGSLQQNITLSAGEKRTVSYFFGGSYQSQQSAVESIAVLKKDADGLFEEKKERYKQLDTTNQLQTNDADLDRMFEWVKYNTDWLIREVPEQGRGLSAGIPDYPWWFGTDNGYAIEGLLAYGMLEEAIATAELVLQLSEKANGTTGKIMHEASTNGTVFNPGNLNTTPRFVSTLWSIYSWVGADSLLQRYWPVVQNSIKWIEEQDHDGNSYPDGPGMMEIPGLHTEMIDVVAYQEQAYRAAAQFADAAGKQKMAQAYQAKALVLQEKINSEWWSEEFGSYADFRATKSQAVELTEAAIVRADTINKPWSVEELEGTLEAIQSNPNAGTEAYVVHHNWVVNTPMETGVADPEKALKALDKAKDYRNRFGMFVTGIDRDEAQEEATQWKAFSYVGAVMTLPTGVQAIGSARYGLIDDAYAYLKNLQNSFGYALPGSMYEVSPDFGMIAQAWNAYAVAVPVVQYFAGIQPNAPSKSWKIDPKLPTGLENLKLTNVRIGDNTVTVSLERIEGVLKLRIDQSNPDWTVLVDRDHTMQYDEITAKSAGDQLAFSGNVIELAWDTN